MSKFSKGIRRLFNNIKCFMKNNPVLIIPTIVALSCVVICIMAHVSLYNKWIFDKISYSKAIKLFSKASSSVNPLKWLISLKQLKYDIFWNFFPTVTILTALSFIISLLFCANYYKNKDSYAKMRNLQDLEYEQRVQKIMKDAYNNPEIPQIEQIIEPQIDDVKSYNVVTDNQVNVEDMSEF